MLNTAADGGRVSIVGLRYHAPCVSHRWLVLLALSGCGRIGFGAIGSGAGDGGAGGDGNDVPAAPSCAPLASTCGATGTASCCTSPVVPGGMFLRSYDGVGYNDSTNPATVPTFRLDAYEVTVARFRAFVMAGMGTQANPPAAGAGARTLGGMSAQGGWDPASNANLPANTPALVTALQCSATYATWTDASGPNDNRPINCVDWNLAMAFCVWDGGFLPTEAEWNYAASGGDEQRAYPWSVPPTALDLDASRASYAPTFDTDCTGDGLPGCTLQDIIPVGSLPAGNGRWGHADLAGNMYEWVLDWYEDAQLNPCDDCEQTSASFGLRAYRGGAFRYAATGLRNGYRNAWTADDRSGFRCARAP
jgi:formylglycine-generating enzyme required for sulfatase activity